MSQTINSLDDFAKGLAAMPVPDQAAADAARARDAVLTKPPGALGRLEDLAVWYAGWRAASRPHIESPQVVVFAGNHGVTAQGVSAFPAEVTVQMVANFQAGGAAVNQLARTAGARMDVYALDLDRPTNDFTQGPAMSEAEVVEALNAGWSAVRADTDLLVVGEMGIGNTTSAAALACALFGGDPSEWCGRGTGLDDAGVANKVRVVTEGLQKNAHLLSDPLSALAALGGRELAAMVGSIAAARSMRIPVILDGFIATSSAAVLERAKPGALDHCVAGHLSDENAHGRLLRALGKEPLLELGLRLGEASGATLAIPILRAALACHSDMATFDEAGVADG